MTVNEFNALKAAGKIKVTSTQKRKAVKRKALEDQATVNSADSSNLVKLVRIEKDYKDGCKVIHHVHPDLKEIIERIKSLP